MLGFGDPTLRDLGQRQGLQLNLEPLAREELSGKIILQDQWQKTPAIM